MKIMKLTSILAPAMMLPACVSTPESNTANHPPQTEPARAPIEVKAAQGKQYTQAEIDKIKLDIANAYMFLYMDREKRRNDFPAENQKIGLLGLPQMKMYMALFGDNWGNATTIPVIEGGTFSSCAEKIKPYAIFPPQSEEHRKAAVESISGVIDTCYFISLNTKNALSSVRDKYNSR